MKDIFDQTIFCNKCNVKTRKNYVIKDGFQMRVLKCPECNDLTFHPGDLKDYDDYLKLRERSFNVKLRMVGNSFCVSIPKELIDFHKDFEREFDELVRLNLEGPGKISIFFASEKYYNNKGDNKE